MSDRAWINIVVFLPFVTMEQKYGTNCMQVKIALLHVHIGYWINMFILNKYDYIILIIWGEFR